ncbi:MAG: hypothetical protein Q4G26_12265, partial [Paracoccus sp. (in: a-proteobacteria)]|nr:hypothetical protein [Paracoccus sp. (in: a-proteobacteria)]
TKTNLQEHSCKNIKKSSKSLKNNDLFYAGMRGGTRAAHHPTESQSKNDISHGRRQPVPVPCHGERSADC